jgi:hypothetical protein
MRSPVEGAVTRASLTGSLCELLAAIGFSAKAILVKLAYAPILSTPPRCLRLLTRRLLFSAPFFVLMALWSKREAVALSHRRGLPAAIRSDT